MIGCGSAPIAPEVLDFLKIAFGGDVMEGKHIMLDDLNVNDKCVDARLRHDRELR
jgi:hypothetical protein